MRIRFCVVYKPVGTLAISKEEIVNKLNELGLIYDEIDPDLVICLGGDGTFLRAFHLYEKSNALFIGINEGNLGFLCDFSIDELDSLYQLIENNDFSNIKEYRLLELKGLDKPIFALNELRIESNDGGTISFHVLINNEYLEKLTADGICFSTSIGSSGINKNLGGACISPNLEIIQITEKTPMNNKFYSSLRSSLVLNKDSKIVLSNISKKRFFIHYDNKSISVIDFKDDLEVFLSNKKISVLKNTNLDYINKLNDAFIK